MQLPLQFAPATAYHPGNIQSMTGQNRALYDWLASGNTIHMMHPDLSRLGIRILNSRISDLRNKCGLTIYDRGIKVGEVYCKEYSMMPF